MNPDGYTSIWAPDAAWNVGWFELEEGLPIYEYFPGRYSSGENLGIVNGYKHFRTNEVRHMFEVGKSDTRTYIIRPPAEGPIQASYAIYAHWAPPSVQPVTNPALDFPPEANSPMPYEFWVWQDGVLDPDAPDEELGLQVHYHIKSWDLGCDLWLMNIWDIMYIGCGTGGLMPHISGITDDYQTEPEPSMELHAYIVLEENSPGSLPGIWPYVIELAIKDPIQPWKYSVATDFYIFNVEIGELDGVW